MRETSARIRALIAGWSPEQFERTYAPGKWDARQILTHLAETDMALGYRVRMALSSPRLRGAVLRSGRVDGQETRASGPEAAAAYFALRQMNLALFARSRRPIARRPSRTPNTAP